MNRESGQRPEDCEIIREILARIGDKWVAVILAVLGNRRLRFKDLHRAGNGISPRMLSVSLRNLERDGLLVRTAHPVVPPHVEYELSGLGRSLREVLGPVGAWVMAHRRDIEDARERFDRARGT